MKLLLACARTQLHASQLFAWCSVSRLRLLLMLHLLQWLRLVGRAGAIPIVRLLQLGLHICYTPIRVCENADGWAVDHHQRLQVFLASIYNLRRFEGLSRSMPGGWQQ